MGVKVGLLAVAVACLASCAGGSSPADSPAPQRPGRAAADSPASHATAGAAVRKVLVIVEENHTAAQVESEMPYLISLGNRYGHTTDYAAVAHPSLPNYLAISGGSTFAVNDDDDPSSHPISGTSVFASGGKSYEQSMPNNCELSDADPYAARHNPLTYFTGERSLCEQNDLPLSALPADLSRGLPNVSMLTPDVDHDAHDGSLGEADAFLKTWIPRIMDGADYKAGRLAIVVTFDEGDSSSQTVYTAVMSPSLHSETVNAGLSHYSLAHWLYRVAGLPPQRLAATAPDLGSAFGL